MKLASNLSERGIAVAVVTIQVESLVVRSVRVQSSEVHGLRLENKSPKPYCSS